MLFLPILFAFAFPRGTYFQTENDERANSLQPTNEEFRELIESRQNMVFSIALRIVRDRTAAEEVAQEVFLCLYERSHEIENQNHLTYWLRRTTAHRAIDWLRRERRSPETLSDDILIEEIPDNSREGPDPWLKRQADALIASLPEVPRAVLVMRYQQEMTPEEIASVLEMPVATVKSHLQRTLKLLREKAARVTR